MSNALNLYQQFLNYLYQTKAIEVPSDFHARCNKVQTLLDNDVTGVVNSLLKYAIDSASETKYRVECENETLQKLLNTWLSEINLEVEGVPTGLSELSKEYLQERLKGSSFCVAKASYWKKLKIGETEIEVPKIMWYVNGASIYVKRSTKKPFVLGSDKLYLDKEYKIPLASSKDEAVIVSKPYSRWQSEYPNIYLIQNGVYKNWKAIEVLQSKSDQALSKVIPYLFLMQKGTLEEFLKGNINYSDKELAEMVNGFKNELEKYNAQQDKTPVDGIPFDVKYEHLIPDLTKILSEELYRQGYRAILSGLGFIDVIQGLTSTRKESVLNPKPFIAEINSCVSGFKSMLLEVVYEIIQRNKTKHPKFFSDRANIYIVNSPLKINVEQILDSIRQGYDRGPVSIQTFQETLGLDPQTERERSKKEIDNGDQELYYPHIIVNQEEKGIDIVQPSKPKTKKQENLENEGKKPGSPEAKKYKNANENLEMAPYKNLDELPAFIKKMTQKCQETFMETFNSVYDESGDESKSMAIGISAAKRCMKKAGYTFDKESKTWKKKV